MEAVSSPALTRKHAARFFWVSLAVGLVVLGAWLVVPHGLIKLAIVAVAGSILGLLVFAYPRHGLYIVMFWVFAGLSYYTSFPVVAPLTLLLAAAVVLQLVRGDSIQTRDAFFNWSLALFIAFALQSFLFAYNHAYAVGSFSSFLKSAMLVFLIGQLIRKEEHLQQLAIVVFAATFSTVVLGVLNLKLGLVEDWTVLVGAIGWLRFGSTHVNPNNAALYLVAGIPLCIYVIKRMGSLTLKLVFVAIAIAMVAATVMTFSRQAIFPLGVVLLAVLFKEARSKWVYAGVVVIAVVAMLLIPQYYWYRISTISQMFEETTQDFSLRIRIKALQAGWHLFLQHPFTGVGMSNFIVRSASELPVRMVAHNGYLEVLTGVGLFGFLAFLMMPAAALRGFVRAFRTRWPEEHRWMNDLSYYFLLCLVAVLIGTFFQHVHFYRLFWLPVGAGLVAGKLADDARRAAKKVET
jgi:O-antigen ligase